MTRAVYEAIGGLDERFGLGLFDDDDLAVRARRAGFELAVAHDLFVHHFGSRTFVGNGIDAERLLEENARRFADKWGARRARGPSGGAEARGSRDRETMEDSRFKIQEDVELRRTRKARVARARRPETAGVVAGRDGVSERQAGLAGRRQRTGDNGQREVDRHGQRSRV